MTGAEQVEVELLKQLTGVLALVSVILSIMLILWWLKA